MSDSLIEAARLIKAASEVLQAGLKVNTYEPPQEIRRISINLETAQSANNPLVIGFPFKSVYVESTTADATINFIPNTRDSFQDKIILSEKDVINFPVQQSKGFLSWDAQASATMNLVFLVSGDLKSGTIKAQITNSECASTLRNPGVTTVTDVVTSIVPFVYEKRRVTLYNAGANIVYIGGIGLSLTTGIPIPVGGYFTYNNKDALDGICAAGLTTSIRQFYEDF